MGGLLGSGPSLDTSAGDTYRSTLSRIGNNFGDMYSQQAGQYQGDAANQNRAANAYSQYLQQMPGTSTQDALYTARAENGMSEAGQNAKAHLSEDLARRGISPNSSAGVGGLSSIDSALAANHANVLANNAQRNQDLMRSNLAQNADLWNNLAGNSFARADSAAGQQAGIANGQLSEADQQALAKYQGKLQNQASQNALWSSLANAGAAAFG